MKQIKNSKTPEQLLDMLDDIVAKINQLNIAIDDIYAENMVDLLDNELPYEVVRDNYSRYNPVINEINHELNLNYPLFEKEEAE